MAIRNNRQEKSAHYTGGLYRWTENNPYVDMSSFDQGMERFQRSQQDIRGLLDQQIEETRRINEESLADRDRAVDIMGNLVGRRSDEFQNVTEQLSQDPADNPFATLLKGSIQDTLQRPDVFSRSQIDEWDARTRENAARAVQDALAASRIQNAQRGVQGGTQQGTERQMQMEAQAQVGQQRGEMELMASQARADNLARAQQIGVSLNDQFSRERMQRLSTLSQMIDNAEARDFQAMSGQAEIIANTVRQIPDYSGIAATLSNLDQQAMDLMVQREQLEGMYQQMINNQNAGSGLGSTISRMQGQMNDQLAGVLEEMREAMNRLGANS